MDRPPDPRLKFASVIHQQLAAAPITGTDRAAELGAEMRSLQQSMCAAQRRLDYCQQHAWPHAARQQVQVLARMCSATITTAGALQEALGQMSIPAPAPQSLREILQDLQQLETEFDAVVLNLKEHTISVSTEPITLDELYLGPFQIVLKLGGQTRRRWNYQVIATEPHPASCNDAVTHPHVRDQELCEGDATVPLRQALAQGRIYDFFVLVRSVLNTYNRASPYVAIDDWEGLSCHDCGSVVASDDSRYCEACGCDFCDDCVSYCRSCDETRCQGCLEECVACSEATCRRCLRACKDCGQRVCDGCLEENLCPACREKDQVSDEPVQPAAAPAAA